MSIIGNPLLLGGGSGGGDTPPPADGKTRVYIHLGEGRTSPMLGIRVNGSVVVDWGDNTATETLTGSNLTTTQWTNTHNYAAAGDYIIALTVTGTARLYGVSGSSVGAYLLRYSSSGDNRNNHYRNAISRVVIGENMEIGLYAFGYCYGLSSLTIPSYVTNIGNSAFSDCCGLAELHFKAETPPTANSSAFSGLPSDCIIYVPTGKLSVYTTTSGYPNKNSYTYIEE